jgi:hypothetical protein
MGTLTGTPFHYDNLLFALKFLFLFLTYCFIAYLFFGREKSKAPGKDPAIIVGSNRYYLAVETGAEALESQENPLFPLDRKLTLGRDESNDIQIHDATASSAHALVEQEGTEPSLEDLGSRNGTFINNEKLTGRQVLHEGDTIRIGMVTFRVRKGE